MAEDNLLTETAAELVGALVPRGGPVASRLRAAVTAEWRRNRSTALRAAEEVTRMSREDLAEAIGENPQFVPLATRLLYAAGLNGHDETLRAMGTALGEALLNPNRLIDCELILTALADLPRRMS